MTSKPSPFLFNSSVESGLRSVCILFEAYPLAFDLQRPSSSLTICSFIRQTRQMVRRAYTLPLRSGRTNFSYGGTLSSQGYIFCCQEDLLQ